MIVLYLDEDNAGAGLQPVPLVLMLVSPGKTRESVGDPLPLLSFRDCHVGPDWLLIYRIDREAGEIGFARTGTHSDLFGY